MAKKRSGALIAVVAVLAIVAVVLAMVYVVMPGLGITVGPGTNPTTTTLAPGQTPPPSGLRSGDIQVTVRHYGNGTAVGNSDLVAYLVPLADVQGVADRVNTKDIGQANWNGGRLTFADQEVWQYYADFGNIANTAGQPFQQGTFASGLCTFDDVLSFNGAQYMVYLIDDATPADGEIGFHAQKITVNSVCDDCQSGDHGVSPNTIYVPWLGNVTFHDQADTIVTEYLDCASTPTNDKVLRVYLENTASLDWTPGNVLYMQVSTTRTLTYDKIVVGGVDADLIAYGDLTTNDPRYDAKPTALATNNSYVVDVGFDSHYVSSSSKGTVELYLMFDHPGAASVTNCTITWAIKSNVATEDSYFGSNTFVHNIQYTGTSAWT